MEKNNMTAVEWVAEKFNLITWLSNRDEISIETALEMRKYHLEQAKQMEKERMIDFAEKYSFNLTSTSAEGFYNETYGKE